MTARYRLVFRGKLLPGMGRDEVVANLAELFRVPLERAQALLAVVPAVIKQDIDVDAGNRYLEALANAGLITHLEPATDANGEPLPMTWDGLERRQGPRERRTMADRRGGNRDAAIRPDRRQNRGRRKTDP
jgi:hypothetical protein